MLGWLSVHSIGWFKGSFHNEDMSQPRTAFVVAYEENVPCGCGAIRPRSHESAEIKRIYSKCAGAGSKIVAYLEGKAKEFGYKRTILSTATVNQHAIDFYHKLGYTVIENYDEYKYRDNAICFEKVL